MLIFDYRIVQVFKAHNHAVIFPLTETKTATKIILIFVNENENYN